MPNDRPNLPAVTTTALPMAPEAVRDHVNAIQKVMQAVMRKDVHFGTIPGTPKPTLYKPGAEVLCMTFHIDPEFEITDLSTPDAYRYRVTCIGRHQQSGIRLGSGLGAASSSEEKYKWRKAVCDEEFQLAPESRKRVKFGKSKDAGGFYKVNQIRSEPEDIDNTVLKMACKRAHVAMTLNVLAASDIFTQDIEDLPEHLREGEPTADPAVVAKWLAAVAGATDGEALKGVWDEGKVELRDIGDSTAYQNVKKAVEDRGAALKGSKSPLADEAFQASLPKWQKLMDEKKKTADEIIATAQTKNTLTEAQIAAIRGPAPDADAKAPLDAIAAMVAKAEEATISEADICKHLKVKKLDGITNAQLKAAQAFVADPAGAAK